MDVNKLTAVITILVILSIATERLVEIVKGFFSKSFQPKIDPATEAVLSGEEELWHKAKNHLLAIVCGIVTAFLASPLLADIFKKLLPETASCKFYGLFNLGSVGECGFDLSLNGLLMILALGLLASGGSGLWNSILEYFVKIKDLKKIEANRERVEYAMARTEAANKGALTGESLENKEN